MKFFLTIFTIVLLSFANNTTPHWETDFEKAKQIATAEHKYILLNFSGSDWCGPCIRMHNEIFNNEKFMAFANQKLVMVNADFPRQEKNQLTKEQQKRNEALADKYNSAGNFPFTLLLSADGKVLEAWNGFPKLGAEEFIIQLSHSYEGN
jgi:thioredoxin-related protein